MKVALLQAPFIVMNLTTCGGLERVEIEEIQGLHKYGVAARLYIASIKPPESVLPSWVRIVKDWGWRHRILKWKYLIHCICANRDADILHGHYTTGLPLLKPDNALVHFHGLAVSELPLYRYGFARRRYHRAHYVFCANHVKDAFALKYPDLPRDHLHVLYNGIDIDRFKPSGIARKTGPVRFSFHGRWVRQKGIVELIEAVKILEARGLEFECHLAGSPEIGANIPDTGEYSQAIETSLAGVRSVHLRGAIPYDELPGFLCEVDFGVIPSTYPDPFPLAPIELMACGLPVVAFRTGGLAELIHDGHDGLLAECYKVDQLADCMEKLIVSQEYRSTLGQAARRTVETQYTWDKHINLLIDLYKSFSSDFTSGRPKL